MDDDHTDEWSERDRHKVSAYQTNEAAEREE